MKNRFSAILLAVLLSLTFLPLSACGKSGVPEETAQTTTASQAESNTEAATSAGTDTTPPETTIPIQTTYKYNEIFKLKPVEIDFKKAVKSGGVTVLDVPWGDTEETFGLYYTELGELAGPKTYTVADDGTIYVYDTANSALKTFKNGAFIKSLDLSGINGQGSKVDIFQILWLDGSIIAIDNTSRACYNITGDVVKRLTVEGEFDIWWETSVQFVTKQNATSFFGLGGYYNKNGKIAGDIDYFDIVSSYYFGDSVKTVIKFAKKDGVSAVYSEDHEGVITHAAVYNNKDFMLLGTDDSGRIYFNVESYEDHYNPYRYLIRFDLLTQKTDIIEIIPEHSLGPVDIRTGWTNSLLLPDGSVYLPHTSETDGVKLEMYSFD